MGRPEKQIPGESAPLNEFARRLRAVRLDAGGPSYRRLTAITHYSASALARAASGNVLPSLEVTLAFVRACGADAGEWRRLWPVQARRRPIEDLVPTPSEPLKDRGGSHGATGAHADQGG